MVNRDLLEGQYKVVIQHMLGCGFGPDRGGKNSGEKNILWKRDKSWVLYVGVKIPLPYLEGWRGKLVRVIHRKEGGGMQRGKHIFLLTRNVGGVNPVS